MVAGVDRYFQIARCFRDEDLRGDRQPEFTQLDLEMSFVDEDDGDGLHRVDGDRRVPCDDPGSAARLQAPFPRFTYDEVMERFGSDKPDVRFGMELVDLAPGSCAITAFCIRLPGLRRGARLGGRVKAIVAPGLAARPGGARSTS